RPDCSSLRRGLHGPWTKEVTSLTRRDLVAPIAAIEAAGRPGAAQDLRRFARVFLEWCVGDGFIAFNPLAGLRRPMRTRAERLKAAGNGGRALSDAEIRQLWQAARRLGALRGPGRPAPLPRPPPGAPAHVKPAPH